jgi:amidase
VPTDPSPATEELAYLGVTELQAKLGVGDLSSVELVETLLHRIDDLDRAASPTALRSVLATSETAIDEARASDERRRRDGERARPLEGIPVLIKDNIEILGLPSSAGSTSLLSRPPTADAPLVTRLREAGAIILGSTNLSEWANIRSPRSTSGWSAVGGLTRNPWALDRNAGGSSSGSGAALAAGLAPLAVGTETDGSITCPSSLNGVAGIKPQVGAVPTAGVVPISISQDSPGPMARTVGDVARAMEVLGGRPDTTERLNRGLDGIRVAAVKNWRTGHPATDTLFDDLVEELGVTQVEAAVPYPEQERDELTVLLCELKDGLDLYLSTRGPGGPQSLAEVIAYEDREKDKEQPWFGHELFLQALALGGIDQPLYNEARTRNLAWALGNCLEPALAGVDALIAPTYGPAWKSDLILGGHPAAHASSTMAAAIAGWPIATVPMGLAQGLPVGLGIIGRPGSAPELLAVAAAVERMRPVGRAAWMASS